MDFREMSESEWKELPEPKVVKSAGRWEEVLMTVGAGKIVALEMPEEKVRGARIGLARRASTLGFKLEFRVQDGMFAVRRSDKPVPPKADKESKPRKTKKSEE